MPVAARYTCRIGIRVRGCPCHRRGWRSARCEGLPARAYFESKLGALPDGCLALDQGQRILQSGEHVGVDRVAVRVRAKPLENVGDEPEEHVRVGQEELRLV